MLRDFLMEYRKRIFSAMFAHEFKRLSRKQIGRFLGPKLNPIYQRVIEGALQSCFLAENNAIVSHSHRAHSGTVNNRIAECLDRTVE